MLFRNTLAQSAQLLSGYLFAFLVAPILLSRVGLAAFGVWAVTGALATYASLLDLGVGRSLSRFVAIYDTGGDRQRVRECLGLGLLMVTAIGLLALSLAVILAPVVADLLHVSRVGDTRLLLVCSATILLCLAYVQALAAVPIGLRRMVPPSVAGMIGNVLNFGFSVGALVLSRRLTDYAVANALAAILAVVPAVVSLVHVWGPTLPAFPSRALVSEVLGFSVKNQVVNLADLVNFGTDKIILAAVVGVRAAGTYELAARVATALRSAAILTVSAMIPTMAARLTVEGRGIIAAHYRRYTERSVAISFPLFALGCLTAPYLLHAWLGRVPADAPAILVAVALAYALNLTTGVASTTALADGQAGMVATNAVLAAVLNVALTVALAPVFGLWGVLAGTFAALTFASGLFIVRFHRRYGLPARLFGQAVGSPLALASALALPFVLVDLLVGGVTGRPAAVAALAGTGGLYALAYWVLASRRGLLPQRLALQWPR